MATTSVGADLTRLHRQAQDDVADLIEGLLRETWPLLDPNDLDGTVDVWSRVALPLVLDGRARSAATAGAYLRAFGQVETGRESRVVISAPRSASVAAETSIRVTGPVTIKSLTLNGWEARAAADAALPLLLASSRRHVLSGGRDTIVDSIRADPRVEGWRRIGSGDCDFCDMLIGRGEVYSADTARFAAHDNCRCSAEPAYDGGEPVSVRQYVASKRNISDTDRARVRDWIAAER